MCASGTARIFSVRANSCTRMAAIFCSLGLLIPWAKIRRTRYILENLAVVTAHGLNGFAAREASETTAVGDAATDFVGIEIGL